MDFDRDAVKEIYEGNDEWYLDTKLILEDESY